MSPLPPRGWGYKGTGDGTPKRPAPNGPGGVSVARDHNLGAAVTKLNRAARREMTTEEAEAVLTLVRGGWLKLELTVGEEALRSGGMIGTMVDPYGWLCDFDPAHHADDGD